MDVILAGDIGGTNTRLALLAPGQGRPLFLREYPSRVHDSLEAVLAVFLAEVGAAHPGVSPTRAGLGVAGPVTGRVATVTNLPWRVDGEALAARLGIPTQVLNDFSALAWAVPELTAGDLTPLGGGTPRAGAVKALIGPGTGLGMAVLVPEGPRWRALPSEGGHADFAPRNAQEARLLEFLRARHGRVSWERVLSGRGLANLFDFLASEPGHQENLTPLRQAMAGEDPAAVITRHAGDSPLCAAALELFCSLLGAAAGNLALTVLAEGGVYVGGGIPPRILPHLQAGFRQAFEAKGRFQGLLKEIPVYVITHPHPGLLGAAKAALA